MRYTTLAVVALVVSTGCIGTTSTEASTTYTEPPLPNDLSESRVLSYAKSLEKSIQYDRLRGKGGSVERIQLSYSHDEVTTTRDGGFIVRLEYTLGWTSVAPDGEVSADRRIAAAYYVNDTNVRRVWIDGVDSSDLSPRTNGTMVVSED